MSVGLFEGRSAVATEKPESLLLLLLLALESA